jgi:hypothetical protein
MRERVDRPRRETGEGFFSLCSALRAISRTPHPALRATFALKERREDSFWLKGRRKGSF